MPAKPKTKLETSPEVLRSADPVLVFDRENAFLLYATFCGDVERTAHALNVRPLDVLRVADEEGWNLKLQAIIQLKKSNEPGDVERAINRALNFVQAHKFRLFLERVIATLYRMTQEETIEALYAESKDGKKFTTRPLADLASAMEKCHAMCYMALNDSASERAKRFDIKDTSSSGAELHAQIADAMAKARSSNSPRAMLFDAQLEIAQATLTPKKKEDDSHEGEDS